MNHKKKHDGTLVYLPTEEEKAKAIAEIQAGWSEEVRRKKAGIPKPGQYEVPTVSEKALELGTSRECERS